MVEASYAVKHPIMDRTNSKTKNYSVSNIISAKIEKTCTKGSKVIQGPRT